METQSAPAIIVLNKKYFSRDSQVAAQVGASSFALSVLKVLHDADILIGVVLYKRDEDLTKTKHDIEPNFWGVPVVTVSFNFRMPDSTISLSLSGVFSYIASQQRHPLGPIVYYQTDTLLQYHPRPFQFCVTHHGPFVSHFTQGFSSSLARLAFGGDSNKVDVLQRQQQTGINRLLHDKFGTVLAHSGLQQRFLEQQGLQSSRFKRLRPPIGIPRCADLNILPLNVVSFIAMAHFEVLLFTAVARLDYFKNVDLVVQAGLELLHRNVPVKVLVVGDSGSDNERRQVLMESILLSQQGHFLVVPRLPKDQLYALFAVTRNKGIFLCPSRYETLGITPLEAAASGVMTLITESSNVEALAYIPACCRVPPTSADIATRVQMVYSEGIDKWASLATTHVRRETCLQGFGDDLLKAWAEMSHSSSARRKHVLDLSDRKVTTIWQSFTAALFRTAVMAFSPLSGFET